MPRVKLFDKKEVLDKAKDLFWKKGYHSTSMQDLVNHLGLSRSSIYDTFGGKKDLFDKTFQLYRTTNILGTTRFLESQDDVKKGFRLLFQTAIQASLTDKDKKGCFVVNTTTALIPGEPEMRDIIQKNKAIYIQLFYDFLKKGQQNKQISPQKDIKAIATLFFTLYNGFKVIGKIQTQADELFDALDTALTLLD